VIERSAGTVSSSGPSMRLRTRRDVLAVRDEGDKARDKCVVHVLLRHRMQMLDP
jgi:hypothetical protein